jgi:hypothetical protein
MTNTSPKILPFVSVAPSRHVYSSGGSACPRCKASVFRISRRFIDLLVSLVMPIRRYRCVSMACNWEGNLREKRASLPGIVRTLL